MYTFIAIGLIILVAYELARWAKMNIPGFPSKQDGKQYEEANDPKPQRDLEDEFGDRLPEYVYDTFAMAVYYHEGGDYQNAYEAYKKIRNVCPEHRSRDLYSESKVFRHNWRLVCMELNLDPDEADLS